MADLTIEPESPRYAADLVLVHGLWVGPWLWRAAAAGFAHRGWRCNAFDARAERARIEAGADDFAAWRERLLDCVGELETAPIVIGHDAGALLALDLAQRGAARAVIAVAPLLDGIRPLVDSWSRALSWLARRDVAPPGPEHALVAAEAGAVRGDLLRQMVGESASRALALDRAAASLGAPAVPTLLLALESDPAVSPVAIEITARGIGADFERYPGGHWPMLGARIDAWMTEIHRWIVKRSGGSLLLFEGDEDLRDD